MNAGNTALDAGVVTMNACNAVRSARNAAVDAGNKAISADDAPSYGVGVAADVNNASPFAFSEAALPNRLALPPHCAQSSSSSTRWNAASPIVPSDRRLDSRARGYSRKTTCVPGFTCCARNRASQFVRRTQPWLEV